MKARRRLAAFAAALAWAWPASAVDVARGEQLYARCQACHALAFDRVGPRHCGLFGRMSGSVPGFDYSAAMKAARIRWDARSLDRFLAGPLDMVPGTSMTYDGVADPSERADLVAYLKAAGGSSACARRPLADNRLRP